MPVNVPGLQEGLALEATFTNGSSHGRDESVDVEAEAAKESGSTQPSEDSKYAVDWEDGETTNPKNWSNKWKWGIVVFLSWITFLTPLASSIFAPGVPAVVQEFRSTSNQLATFVVSVFVLGFAFGPLLVAPMSEIYGRTPIYHICNVLFVCFSVGCALANSMGMLIAFRFLSGFAGVAAVTCGAGSIADMLPAETRGKAMSIWSLGPLLGPTIGPAVAGFVIDALGWRWAFWIVVIAGGATTLVAFVILKETYAPVLLERKAAKMRKETGNDKYYSVLSQVDGFTQSPKKKLTLALVRPMRMLLLQPIVTIMAIYIAVLYGVLYILFTTFTFVYEDQYGFSSIGAGLSFLSCGIGMLFGLFAMGNLSDRILRRAKDPKPETRLHWILVGPASVLIPIGLLIYGWAAYFQTHWIGPMIGAGIMSFGSILINMSVQTYLVDSFPIHAASVSAANTVLRSTLGALLPLAGLGLYDAIGLGWGNTLLAGIALVLAPVPVAMGIWGERVRNSAMSKRH
ncbi:unnamed protein product [Discula destructiva]